VAEKKSPYLIISKNLQKLSLGTVQFGIRYGINNTLGLLDNLELSAIFENASRAGIDLLDTAPAYGNAEEKIGEFSGKRFKIVSKFSNVNNSSELKFSLANSLSNLDQDKIYGYLAHNADQILSHPECWDTLYELKDSQVVEKVGYSVYTTDQLEELLNRGFLPDLVQLPFSLLDRKFSSFLPQLKSIGTEIHVRSVFLQGLYFMDLSKLPGKLLPLKTSLEEINRICLQSNTSISSLALNFAINNPFIDKVVIGVDSPEQLKENILNIESWKPIHDLTAKINQIEILKSELLNPSNW
jgi:aryl-alcohol dehydrogenase-like predicted oxidoreductase